MQPDCVGLCSRSGRVSAIIYASTAYAKVFDFSLEKYIFKKSDKNFDVIVDTLRVFLNRNMQVLLYNHPKKKFLNNFFWPLIVVNNFPKNFH